MNKTLHIHTKISDNSFIKTAPFKKHIRSTAAHVHNGYFQIVYLFNTQGTHVIDQQVFNIEQNHLFFIKKGEVHHWEILSEPFGYVLIIKKEFIDNSKDVHLKQLFFSVTQLTSLVPSDSLKLSSFFDLLVEETDTLIIEQLIKALFLKILNHSKTTSAKRTTNIYHHFIDLLSQDNHVKNSVKHYAEQLHTTPQNLTASCKKETTLSASDILAQYIIIKAKRLLSYTDFTVKQIALELDFNDASHFVKYFKKHTTLTPNSFRNK